MESNIIADLKNSYGITYNQITPVTGGLMNLKWKITTEQGELLVKQYSMKRFNRDRMDRIEAALQRQMILEQHGVPCPLIWPCGGRAIRWLNDQTAYMVMDFYPGKTEKPDTITVTQMHSLGSACAVMHRAFSRIPVPPDARLPVSGGYTPAALWDNYSFCRDTCAPEAPAEYREPCLTWSRS